MERMPTHEPAASLDGRFSSPGAEAAPWDTARRTVSGAELYWLATVRADGRPHITPLLGIWMDERLHFCTGPGEQKAKNLDANGRWGTMTITHLLADHKGGRSSPASTRTYRRASHRATTSSAGGCPSTSWRRWWRPPAEQASGVTVLDGDQPPAGR